jgi:DNA mismatch repair protein MutS
VISGERFVTPELKDFEEKVLRAEEHLLAREKEIFDALVVEALLCVKELQSTSRAIAVIDVIASLAEAAQRLNYVKPRLAGEGELVYREGRHPVVESVTENPFVANDLSFASAQDSPRLFIVTGPNMGGKSTFLRQTGLMVVMAQMGSFVPALEAKLTVCDRLFTRVGASDYLLRGQSTFMVEMQETAYILRHASDRSLLLLDEIGRGTATFDGLSIAWAVAEHLADRGAHCPRTLFATHYHELVDLAVDRPTVSNLHVTAREWKDDILFLRRVEPGGSDRSFGIQVAKLSGLPSPVVKRAREILKNLEQTEFDSEGRPKLARTGLTGAPKERQLSLFAPVSDAVADDIRKTDVNALTPIEALNMLVELKKKLEG